MEVIETEIPDVKIVVPDVFRDARGYFVETYNAERYAKAGITAHFVQDNESKSSRGVLRGLHFQINYPQTKLVRVIRGAVFDVAVDLRKSSPTFGHYVMVELSDENKRQFFIPRCFAHGFLVLSDEAIFTYKVDNIYAPQEEAGIRWNDPDLGIQWPIDLDAVQTSEKDLKQPFLRDAEVFD